MLITQLQKFRVYYLSVFIFMCVRVCVCDFLKPLAIKSFIRSIGVIKTRRGCYYFRVVLFRYYILLICTWNIFKAAFTSGPVANNSTLWECFADGLRVFFFHYYYFFFFQQVHHTVHYSQKTWPPFVSVVRVYLYRVVAVQIIIFSFHCSFIYH